MSRKQINHLIQNNIFGIKDRIKELKKSNKRKKAVTTARKYK